jgi:hypothetical protein
MGESIGIKFIKRIYGRLRYKNKNWLAIICGETGSGKSYSALSLGSKIGRVHIVFNPLEFMTLLNSDKLSKGDVIIFDEAGVGISSREWYTVQNKLIGSVLQTFRNMNLAVIFTTPNLSFIDIQARKLFHNYFETAYLDYEKKETYLKVYDIQVNSRLDKIYYKNPKIRDDTGRVYCMDKLILDKPADKLVEYYEDRKTRYTDKLNKDVLAELQKGKEHAQRKEVDYRQIAKEITRDKKKYLKEYNGRKYIDIDLIRSKYSIGFPSANRIKKEVESEILV